MRKAERALAGAVETQKAIGESRKLEKLLLRKRNRQWLRAFDAGATRERIAQACDVSIQAVDIGLAEARESR